MTTIAAPRIESTNGLASPQSDAIQTTDDQQTVSDFEGAGWLAKVKSVYRHSEVESIFVSINADMVVDYWIVIPHRDLSLVRMLVEEQQRDVIDLFAQTENPPFQVDFHICYREGQDHLSSLVPDQAIYLRNL